jgi:hypothetical protein
LTRRKGLSQRKLTLNETKLLQEVLSADYKDGNIRLREGEYQYSLAKAIASFHLELHFPDVKEIIKRLYGEEKTNDIQFIRMIQTILKKMEKSNIVKILPKKNPWDLQRYMLSSFKFRDSEKTLVEFATDEQIKQAQNLLRTIINQQETVSPKLINTKVKISLLLLTIIVSYTTILWNLTQSDINPVIFIPALSIAVACSLLLGKVFSKE